MGEEERQRDEEKETGRIDKGGGEEEAGVE